jgi:HSP20 family protein
MSLYRSLFPRDFPSRDFFFGAGGADFERLQRELASLFEAGPAQAGIRGQGRGGYPALNVGSTPTTVEVYAFAPGLEASSIEVNLERGVLTLAGERKPLFPLGSGPTDARTVLHVQERYAGRFRRVLSLPEDIDPEAVTATYADGVLHVSIARKAAAQPRRVVVQ